MSVKFVIYKHRCFRETQFCLWLYWIWIFFSSCSKSQSKFHSKRHHCQERGRVQNCYSLWWQSYSQNRLVCGRSHFRIHLIYNIQKHIFSNFALQLFISYYIYHDLIPFHRVGDLLPKVVVWVLRIPPMKSNWSIRQLKSLILANTMLFYPMKRALILPLSTSMLLVSLYFNVLICCLNLVVFMQMVQNIWIGSWVFCLIFRLTWQAWRTPGSWKHHPRLLCPHMECSQGQDLFCYFVTHLLCTK